MSRVAFFDLANGISGDMVLGALAHVGRRLGIDVEQAAIDAVASLDLEAAVSFVDDERGGLACLRAEVKTPAERHPPQRLRAALEQANVSERALARALASFSALVEAESAVHGVPPSEVHLHELGSADTAVDIVGSAAALDVLDVSDVAAAPVPVPSGWIDAAHGQLPLPAPVTLELVRGKQLRSDDSGVELVTPTGIAVLVGHDAAFGELPPLVLEEVGTGAGSRITERPNISRVLIGHRADGEPELETCVLLETNIDDQTPQSIGHAVELLLQHGALDAWITPIVMKRSRPAFLLSALVTTEDETRITDAIFRSTTTLGVRRRVTTRRRLAREMITVRLHGTDVRVKVARLRGEVVNVAPEFADCAALAERIGIGVDDVRSEAAQLARAELTPP